jgi:hypothetical protein
MIIEIIAIVIIGTLIIHYIYTNSCKLMVLHQSREPQNTQLHTVTAVEVQNVPLNTQVIVVTEEIS